MQFVALIYSSEAVETTRLTMHESEALPEYHTHNTLTTVHHHVQTFQKNVKNVIFLALASLQSP